MPQVAAFNKLQHAEPVTPHQYVVAALFTTYWHAATGPVCKALCGEYRGSILMQENRSIELASGKHCKFLRIRRDLIQNYYILAFPKSQGEPSKEEVSEMVTLGIEYAKSIAKEYVGDPEAYTLLYSGYSARREKGWHIHIVLLGNRWKKAWLYLVLAGKNILQAIGLRKDDSPRIER